MEKLRKVTVTYFFGHVCNIQKLAKIKLLEMYLMPRLNVNVKFFIKLNIIAKSDTFTRKTELCMLFIIQEQNQYFMALKKLEPSIWGVTIVKNRFFCFRGKIEFTSLKLSRLQASAEVHNRVLTFTCNLQTCTVFSEVWLECLKLGLGCGHGKYSRRIRNCQNTYEYNYIDRIKQNCYAKYYHYHVLEKRRINALLHETKQMAYVSSRSHL